MADGFIVRKGGVTTEQALAPTITKVSETETSITFTLKNNDAETATLVYRYSSLTGDGESISLATNTTSSNITVSSITFPGTLFVTANATGKVKSSVVEAEYTGPVFTEATGGTTLEYDSGGARFKSHTFTSNGNFVVSTVGNGDRNKVDYLIIAGAGGGGTNQGNGTGGGGGGTGGYRTTVGTSGQNSTARDKVTVTASTFGVTVGSGGTGSTVRTSHGNNGTASSVAFGTTISSTGGGGGGSDQFGGTQIAISPGGGGSGNNGSGIPLTERDLIKTGGSAVADEFFSGGNGPGIGTENGGSGGGGGGAASIGSNGVTPSGSATGGSGGTGLANLLRTGSNETRGVGGKGGDSLGSNSNGANGTANTGNGGAGANANAVGGNGGSGIVVIRYEIAPSV